MTMPIAVTGLRLNQDLLADARKRDKKCAKSLQANSIDDALHLFPGDGSHFFVDRKKMAPWARIVVK